ncbi:MAG: 3-deoxy-7-phosphoheptulonate synthase [Solobacterium sp.]|nr:3-deoxy-7-phosphoheptulonate synthase [Solobacterium sp.]
MDMEFSRKLPGPDELKSLNPVSSEIKKIKAERDQTIKDIIEGRDRRMLLIIGPCSADHEDPVLEYMGRLRKVQDKVIDRIFMVPRIYTNKPRTIGLGYKGMMYQPDPEKKEDLLQGLIAIRNMHLKTAEQTGFTCADEMLYPENHVYLDDLLSYVAVGARSVENQQHRLVASGIGIAAGMKNPTGGDLNVMMNSVVAAQSAHTFQYRTWEVHTKGNPHAHIILRGYVDKYGRNIPNYHYEELMECSRLYSERGLANPAVIVDCNHSNSGKKYLQQIRISKDVLYSRKVSSDIRKLVKGLMIESYLEDGSQKANEHCYGKSITDPCLGWQKSEDLICELADQWEF